MAPSANRRSGHSRRAQYSTFFGYIAGVAGALVGAIVVVLGAEFYGVLRTRVPYVDEVPGK